MVVAQKTGRKLRKRLKELPFHLMLLPAVVMVVLLSTFNGGVEYCFSGLLSRRCIAFLNRNGADGKF